MSKSITRKWKVGKKSEFPPKTIPVNLHIEDGINPEIVLEVCKVWPKVDGSQPFNAELIAEAGTIYIETGMGPREMQKEIDYLRDWKKAEIELFQPFLELMHWHPELKVGDSISKKAIEFIKERNKLKKESDARLEALEYCNEAIDVSYINDEPIDDSVKYVIKEALSGKESRNQKLKDENEKLKEVLGKLMRSMLAHPDCTEGSEFDDMTSIANDLIKSLDNE